jgi:kinesin light chain
LTFASPIASTELIVESNTEKKMTQEDVISNTKTVIQGLEALKNENNTLLNGIRSTLAKTPPPNENSFDRANYLLMQEKAAIIEKSISSIELGLSEAQVMIALQQHLQMVEAEKHKLRAQAKRLSQENAWLRDELSKTQQKLMDADKEKITLEQENKHLKFNLSLKEIDGQANTAPSSSVAGGSIDDNAGNNGSTIERNKSDSDSALELGFPDEYDVQQGNQAENVNNAPNAGYEVPARIRTLHNLVIKYAQKGRYEVAVPLCKQALEDLEKTSGANHPDFATMLNILALVYRDQHLYREATQLLNEALQIREKTLGPDDPGVAATLNNLAVLYGKRGLYEEALPLCKRALAIREKRYGPDHPDVAKQLNNLALLCVNLGRFDEVHQYYSRAIEIYEKALGPNDPVVYKTKNNLASALYKKSDFKRADAIYKEVISRAHEKEFGKISEDNKPIWQIAEEREEIKAKRRENPPPALEYGRIPIINET